MPQNSKYKTRRILLKLEGYRPLLCVGTITYFLIWYKPPRLEFPGYYEVFGVQEVNSLIKLPGNTSGEFMQIRILSEGYRIDLARPGHCAPFDPEILPPELKLPPPPPDPPDPPPDPPDPPPCPPCNDLTCILEKLFLKNYFHDKKEFILTYHHEVTNQYMPNHITGRYQNPITKDYGGNTCTGQDLENIYNTLIELIIAGFNLNLYRRDLYYDTLIVPTTFANMRYARLMDKKINYFLRWAGNNSK